MSAVALSSSSSFRSPGKGRGRRFQSTHFGLERDVSRGDALPDWKQASLQRMRQRARSRRQELVDKFRGLLKDQEAQGSPNTKMKRINRSLTEFRDELVREEMAQLAKSRRPDGNMDASMPDWSSEHKHAEQKRPEEGREARDDPIEKQRVFGIQDVVLEEVRRSFAEMMEEMFFKGLREELRDIADARENDYLNWAVPEEIPDIICPLCLHYEVGTTTVDADGVPLNVYACVCGAEFQPSNSELRQRPQEERQEHEKRLMDALRQRLGSFADFHSRRCVAVPVFEITKRRMLKVSCESCHLNELVV